MKEKKRGMGMRLCMIQILLSCTISGYAGNSKVYAHEVVIRPLEDGGVQYVSNQIIPSEDNYRETWHTPRLTLEEWEELYGGE